MHQHTEHSYHDSNKLVNVSQYIKPLLLMMNLPRDKSVTTYLLYKFHASYKCNDMNA